MSYDIHDYARLGLLHELLHVEDADHPSPATVAQVQKSLLGAVADARTGAKDLNNRLTSQGARDMRKAGLAARELMQQQWRHD
jgi:hypothetical protein